MRLYLANVGVNTADARLRGLKSPVFLDRTFEFVPIKESASFAQARSIPRYRDLPSWTGRARSIADFLPDQFRKYKTHADPEFETFTYGDIRSPRASHLRRMGRGDELWFLARLWSHDGDTWTGRHALYLIGYLVVRRVIELPEGPSELLPQVVHWIENNAHWRRRLAGDRSPATIVVGDRSASRRFEKAIQVTPEVAGLIYGGKYDPSTGV
jgi:hypothetical protein